MAEAKQGQKRGQIFLVSGIFVTSREVLSNLKIEKDGSFWPYLPSKLLTMVTAEFFLPHMSRRWG
jgi:hypothetical protein